MRTLASKIQRQLEVGGAGHYAVYEEDLERIWPLTDRDRKAKLEQFAKEYGFHLAYYKEGLCAIFDKGHTTPKKERGLSD